MHPGKTIKSILAALCVLLVSTGSAAVQAQSTPGPTALPAPETLPPVRRDQGSVIGGAMPQSGQAVAVTASGAVWLAGGSGGLVRGKVDHTSILLARVNAAGTTLEHVSSHGDAGVFRVRDAQVDGSGKLWICGETSSRSLPQREDGWNPIYQGQLRTGFISRHGADGQMEWSSYVGGTGRASCAALVVNPDGSGYLAGDTTATTIPGTAATRAPGNSSAGFVMAWSAEGNLSWGSFVDGSGKDTITSMALAGNSLWLGGVTASADLPASANAWQRTHGGGGDDAFIARMSTAGTLEHLSYMGGSGREEALHLASDGKDIWFAGTSSSPAFLGAVKADVDVYTGQWRGAAPAWHKVYGGSGRDRVFSISVGDGKDLWLSGMSTSRDFPVSADAAQPSRSVKRDAFVMRLSATDGGTEHSSYLGGNDADEAYAVKASGSTAWVSGMTFSADFPGTGLRLPLGDGDAFIQRYDQSNRPPRITSVPPETATVGESYSYTAEAEDDDGDAVAWRLVTGPTGMSISGSELTWPLPVLGEHPVELEARDSRGASATQSYVLRVLAANKPPRITSTAPTTATVDMEYSYRLQAVDDDGDSLSYALQSAPLGMAVEADVITWEPAAPGDYDATVTVSDGRGGSASQGFSVTVSYAQGSTPPTLTAVGNHTIELGTQLKLQLVATDADGDALSYSARPLPLPQGATLSATTGEFVFKPQVHGTHTLEFSVSDGRFSASSTGVFTVPEPAEDAQSRFTGRVLDAQSLFAGEEIALVGVIVSLHGTSFSATTDSEGRFTLSGYTGGRHVLDLNSASATSSLTGVTYAGFREKITLRHGVHEREERAFTLPRLAASGATGRVTVNPNGETVLKEESMGIELRIPQGVARNEDGTPYTGELYVSEVPRDLAPAALPAFMDPSLLITIQPVGVVFSQPVPITFPNTDDLPPGYEADIWSLDPTTGAFAIVGKARVTADGESMETIEGGIRRADWHLAGPNTPEEGDDDPPPPPPGECGCNDSPIGSTVNLDTGAMNTSVSLPAYRSLGQSRSVSLSYRSSKANPARTIEMNARVRGRPALFSYRLEHIGGLRDRGQGEMYLGTWDFSTGEGKDPRNYFRLALPFEAMDMATGVYRYRVRHTNHYPLRSVRTTGLGAILGQPDSQSRSTLPPRTRDDGSRMSRFFDGEIVVDNKSDSPYGAGWEVDGVYRLSPALDGNMLLQTPGAGSVIYSKDSEGNFVSPGIYYVTLVEERDDADELTGYRMTDREGKVRIFDADGLITSAEDRNGNRTSYSYETYRKPGESADSHRLSRITDPVGRQTAFRYSNGYLSEIEDPAGRVTSFRHSARGDLLAVTYPDGSGESFVYDRHRMTRRTDERGNATQYSYSPHGHLVQVTLPDATQRNIVNRAQRGLMADDEGGRAEPGQSTIPEKVRSSYTDARGNPVLATMDADGYPLVEIDAEGRETIYQRDAKSNVTSKTRPNGTVTNMEYDALGNMTRMEEEFNGAVNTYEYNQFSQVTKETDPRGNSTTREYDSKGNLTKTTNALGHVVTTQYDSRGLITRIQTPNDLVITYQYNSNGLLQTKTETPPSGSPGVARTTTYTYHPTGFMATVTTPEGVTYSHSYDKLNRKTSVRDNIGQQMTYQYDAYGNVTRTETKNSDGSLATWMESAYDNRNRFTAITSPHKTGENSVWRVMYDAEDNVTAITDPAGNVDMMRYDAINRLSASTHRLSGSSSYEYDKLNQLTKVTAPTGIVTSYEYDGLGRLVKERSPDRGTITYSYDLSDNLTQIVTGRGITESYSYDELDRPTGVSYPNTSPGKDEDHTYTYDTCAFGKGHLCKIEDESGTTQYSHDAFGNVTSKTKTELGVSYTTSYTWDKEDQISSMTLPSGRAITYSRDSVRRLHGIEATVNGTKQTIVSDISYRADGMMLGCTYGNGLTDARTYDLQSRLTSQSLKKESSTVDQRSYGYDVKGNITTMTANGDSISYTYDALDRLTSESYQPDDNSTTYGIDLNHNRQTTTEQPGTSDSYGYLDSSNKLRQISEVDQLQALPTPKPNESYEYNDAGRLWRYHKAGKLTAEYIYNAGGQRTRKTIYDDEGNPTATTIYHWAMGLLVEETTQTGTLTRSYIMGAGIMPIAQVDMQQGQTTEQITYLYADHLQTPRLATSATGSVTWRWEGDGFGEDTPTGTAKINIRFPGQYHDSESGLHYNLHRYYDPTTGRYLRSDPIGLQGGTNTYTYANHNPIGSADPEGMVAPIVIAAAIVGRLAAPAIGKALSGTVGALIGSGIGIGIGIGLGDLSKPHKIDDPLTDSEEDQKDAEYEAYKDQCKEAKKKPEETCEDLKSKIEAYFKCGNMRLKWVTDWEGGETRDKGELPVNGKMKSVRNHRHPVVEVVNRIKELIKKMKCICDPSVPKEMEERLKLFQKRLNGFDHLGDNRGNVTK